MRSAIARWYVYLLALVSAGGGGTAWAQDGIGMAPTYPAGIQSPLVQPVAMDAAAQPVAPEAPPVPPKAPLAAAEDPNAELNRRIAALEKRLAASTKADPPAADPPAKPLIAPSGRIQFDGADFNQNAASMTQLGNVKNAVGFRRARIALLGEYQTIDYIIEMDFASQGPEAALYPGKEQSTAFKDVYIQARDLPLLGNVRAGHCKEPFGLEQLTSDNFTTFMERSVDDEGAFVPGRNDGVMFFDWSPDQRITWAAGAFTNATGQDQPPLIQVDEGGCDATGRLTWLPWYDEATEGRGLLHLGVDYSYRSAPAHTIAFATRPEMAFAPDVVNLKLNNAAGVPDVKDWRVVGAEAATVYGPLSVQAEYFASTIQRLGGATDSLYGGYIFVSYFFTGESRPYNRKMGVFDRVHPYENFFRVLTGDGVANGWGAWELALRVSYIDTLHDLEVAGSGRAVDYTFGTNWYWNPYTRVMFNYVRSFDTMDITNSKGVLQRVPGGLIDGMMIRLAMDF
jgi:phosphate-selective porin OprO/OprP